MRRNTSLTKLARLEKGELADTNGAAIAAPSKLKLPLSTEEMIECLAEVLSALYVYICLAVKYWVPRHPAWDTAADDATSTSRTADGAEALEMVGEEKLDLVITDSELRFHAPGTAQLYK